MTRRRQTILITIIVLLCGITLSCVALLLLPDLIETRILPRLASQAGLPSLKCRINHLGFTKTNAGPLSLGSKTDPGVTVEQITLLYNPSTILRGELAKVIISGVSIKTIFSKGTITIPGLEELITKSSQNKTDDNRAPEHSTIKSRLPIPPFTELKIERSVINYEMNGKDYRIPFSLQLKKSIALKPGSPSLQGTLQILPRGTPITLKIKTTLDEEAKLHLKLKADAVDLLNFADILQIFPTLKLKGQLALNADADISLAPLTLESLKAKLVWHNGLMAYNNFRISTTQSLNSGPELKPENDALVLNLQKKDPSAAWQLTINQIFFGPPFRPAISDINISAETASENIKLKGNCTTLLSGHFETFRWTKPLRKNWLFSAAVNQRGIWQANLESPADNASWKIEQGDLTISGNSPAISIKASGFREKGEIKCLLTLNKTAIKDTNKYFNCPTIKAETNINLDSATPQIRALLQFTDGTLQASDYALQIKGISGTLPLNWPVIGNTLRQKGKLGCRKIFFKDFEFGQFSASLQQQEKNILLKGRYESSLFDGLEIMTKGECELDRNGTLKATGSFKIPPFKPKKPINLGDFSKTANGNLLDGTFSANGTLSFDARGFSGNATVNAEDALFRNPEKNLGCTGILCRLHFPELPSLRSAPNQTLVFDQLTAGNIIFKGGNLAFQIESEKTLLLEKGRLAWCGGNIETQALRISPAVDHYQSTLYCDRLQLTELLEQLGEIEAQGQGSVNGRIPIAWENGKITFDDGFLYSTPGQGGTIKITDDNSLITGLPTSNPQFAQLDLAREALKDYQYQWTKMKLNSEADELILNLQFDGKPRLPLPFVYKKELGSFARVTANHPGSNFQGINLDINLRLPLNHLLQYKDLSTMLE